MFDLILFGLIIFKLNEQNCRLGLVCGLGKKCNFEAVDFAVQRKTRKVERKERERESAHVWASLKIHSMNSKDRRPSPFLSPLPAPPFLCLHLFLFLAHFASTSPFHPIHLGSDSHRFFPFLTTFSFSRQRRS